MTRLCLLAAAALLATAPVRAQTPAASQPEKPVDVGPNTPAANQAYQSGGVVLQGAPGAPAPTPQATAPGQAPANAAPPK